MKFPLSKIILALFMVYSSAHASVDCGPATNALPHFEKAYATTLKTANVGVGLCATPQSLGKMMLAASASEIQFNKFQCGIIVGFETNWALQQFSTDFLYRNQNSSQFEIELGQNLFRIPVCVRRTDIQSSQPSGSVGNGIN